MKREYSSRSRHFKPNLLVLLAGCALACGPPITPLQLPRFAYSPPVDGVVVGVDRGDPSQEINEGLHVTIAQEGNKPKVSVVLAPGWYLEQHGLRFSERDRLSVEGSVRPGDPTVFAQRVSKGPLTVRLRDDSGQPLWRATPQP